MPHINIILIIIFSLFFAFTTWQRFYYGLAIFFLLLPTYLIRFSLGPLPTTLLEVMLWIITIIWLIKYRSLITNHLSQITKQYPTLFIAISLFLIAATMAMFTSLDLRSAAGEWKAFYLEPILLFLVIITTLKHNNTQTQSSNLSIFQSAPLNTIIFGLILGGLATSILAIIQHFTGWLVPWAFWENRHTYRVTGWYGFPNAVGLFLAPLIPLSFYLINNSYKCIKQSLITDHQSQIIYRLSLITSLFFIPCSFLAILFAKSTGALVGLTVALLMLLLFYKKTRWWALTLGIIAFIIILTLPQLTSLKQELIFQDRSGQIRLAMWGEATEFLSHQPIFGAGLASYQAKIKPYHTTVNNDGIEIFHHPHNIFLTMWVNLGILGLFSFIWILVWFFKNGFTNFGNWKLPACRQGREIGNFRPFIIASMITILVMGLVDSPYIKNDLAILFWLLPALMIISLKNDKPV